MQRALLTLAALFDIVFAKPLLVQSWNRLLYAIWDAWTRVEIWANQAQMLLLVFLTLLSYGQTDWLSVGDNFVGWLECGRWHYVHKISIHSFDSLFGRRCSCCCCKLRSLLLCSAFATEIAKSIANGTACNIIWKLKISMQHRTSVRICTFVHMQHIIMAVSWAATSYLLYSRLVSSLSLSLWQTCTSALAVYKDVQTHTYV